MSEEIDRWRCSGVLGDVPFNRVISITVPMVDLMEQPTPNITVVDDAQNDGFVARKGNEAWYVTFLASGAIVPSIGTEDDDIPGDVAEAVVAHVLAQGPNDPVGD